MINEVKIQNNIEEEVLKKIECGDVKMKPKSYFLVKAIILILFTFSIFVLTTVLVSFIIFTLLNRGDLFLLGFGGKGLYKFILMFPWYLLVVNAVLLILLDYLIRRFRFGYNSPVIYLFLGTLVFVTTFSYVINYTSIHRMLYGFASRNNLPYAGMMYDRMRIIHNEDGVFRGVVTSIGDDYIIVKPANFQNHSELIKVYAPEGIDLKNFVKVGEEIYIAGDIATGTEVLPYGIKRVGVPSR